MGSKTSKLRHNKRMTSEEAHCSPSEISKEVITPKMAPPVWSSRRAGKDHRRNLAFNIFRSEDIPKVPEGQNIPSSPQPEDEEQTPTFKMLKNRSRVINGFTEEEAALNLVSPQHSKDSLDSLQCSGKTTVASLSLLQRSTSRGSFSASDMFCPSTKSVTKHYGKLAGQLRCQHVLFPITHTGKNIEKIDEKPENPSSPSGNSLQMERISKILRYKPIFRNNETIQPTQVLPEPKANLTGELQDPLSFANQPSVELDRTEIKMSSSNNKKKTRSRRTSLLQPKRTTPIRRLQLKMQKNAGVAVVTFPKFHRMNAINLSQCVESPPSDPRKNCISHMKSPPRVQVMHLAASTTDNVFAAMREKDRAKVKAQAFEKHYFVDKIKLCSRELIPSLAEKKRVWVGKKGKFGREHLGGWYAGM